MKGSLLLYNLKLISNCTAAMILEKNKQFNLIKLFVFFLPVYTAH